MQREKNSRLFAFLIVLFACLSIVTPAQTKQQTKSGGLKIVVSFTAQQHSKPLDGRMLLLISGDGSAEPRFQVGEDPDTQLVFGVDVEGLRPGRVAVFDHSAFGYPIRSLADLPPGEYFVQALLHKYETFHRKDGHTVKLPMDRGEGQQWNRAPGNLYSTPRKIRVDPRQSGTIALTLDKVIPPIPPPKDTKYIRHVKMQSRMLSEFWGRPMELGANVLLPEGFDQHPDARYPLVIFHGHFPYTFEGFRPDPPDPNLKPDYSKRFRIPGYNKIQQEHAHQFYRDWTSPNFPRFIIIEIQHANPYYDDSYAVNSQNLGPYGDAITYELIPFVEKQFRGIGKGWARFLYGGSTGGWEALAAQVFYPDEYNGCWAACPDPIDFRAYTTINLYEDKNAYYVDNSWKKVPRPGKRNFLGHLAATVEQMNHYELALGTKSRSGQQFDIWEAVYSPVGPDGYPKRIFDKLNGGIDRAVAEYWRENYDLGHIIKRDWPKIGRKLEGKIHIYCGDMDNFYLNNAVYLVEETLKNLKDPLYAGEVDYGDRAEHCWNGDHDNPIWISRLRYHQFFAPRIVTRMMRSAPADADLKSWRY
jgi:hypothetical protein